MPSPRFDQRGYIDLGEFPASNAGSTTWQRARQYSAVSRCWPRGRDQGAITNAEREVYFGKTQFTALA